MEIQLRELDVSALLERGHRQVKIQQPRVRWLPLSLQETMLRPIHVLRPEGSLDVQGYQNRLTAVNAG